MTGVWMDMKDGRIGVYMDKDCWGMEFSNREKKNPIVVVKFGNDNDLSSILKSGILSQYF